MFSRLGLRAFAARFPLADAKRFLTYAAIQTVAYSLLVLNMRAVAHGWLALALLTDAAYAALAFTIIKKIAKDESCKIGAAGYVFGSLIGTTIGMSF